ncbi:MAG: hypothetical protein ACW99U_17095 [Candidatus Thorarchaeota archaeon]|jgi:hypothetical protein
MKRIGKALVMLVCVVGLILMFGCAAFQDLATPCHIDQEAIDYASIEPTSYLPWPTLWDAQRLRKEILYRHDNLQIVYQRLQEDDSRRVTYIIDSLDTSVAGANEFKEKVFDPSGPVGTLLPMLFGGTIGAMFINTGKKQKA